MNEESNKDNIIKGIGIIIILILCCIVKAHNEGIDITDFFRDFSKTEGQYNEYYKNIDKIFFSKEGE